MEPDAKVGLHRTIARLPAVERVPAIAAAMEAHRQALADLAAARRAAVAEALDEVGSVTELARRWGISRQQVHRLLGPSSP